MDERAMAQLCANPTCAQALISQRRRFCSERCEVEAVEWSRTAPESMPYARSQDPMSQLLKLTFPNIDPVKVDQLRQEMIRDNQREAEKVVSLRVRERTENEAPQLEFEDAETIETIREESERLKSTSLELKRRLDAIHGSELQKRMEAMKIFDDGNGDDDDEVEEEEEEAETKNEILSDSNYENENESEWNHCEMKKNKNETRKTHVKHKSNQHKNRNENEDEEEEQLKREIWYVVMNPSVYIALWTDMSRWITRHSLEFLRPDMKRTTTDSASDATSSKSFDEKSQELKLLQSNYDMFFKLGMFDDCKLMEEAIQELRTSMKSETYSTDPLPERDAYEEERFRVAGNNIDQHLVTICNYLELNPTPISSAVYDLLNTFNFSQSIMSTDVDAWKILSLIVVRVLLTFKKRELVAEQHRHTAQQQEEWNRKIQDKLLSLGIASHEIQKLERLLQQGVY